MKLNLILTNDDGYEAPGLYALAELARSWGSFRIIAPREQQSQLSHAVTLSAPLHVSTVDQPGLGTVEVVDGTPADCVRLIDAIAPAPRADWVLAGINRGANLGVDVYYSGTAAAAREAAIQGYPAVAVSQYVIKGREVDWDAAKVLVGRAIEWIFARPHVPGTFWTVTVPALDGGHETAPIVEAPLSIDPLLLRLEPDKSPGAGDPGPRAYVNAGRYADRPRRAGTDVDVVFRGRIAVTRLTLDATYRP